VCCPWKALQGKLSDLAKVHEREQELEQLKQLEQLPMPKRMIE